MADAAPACASPARFNFLINHGVRPFQAAVFDFPAKDVVLVPGPVSHSRHRQPWHRSALARRRHRQPLLQHTGRQVFSDKLSKLVIRCDEQSSAAVFQSSAGFSRTFSSTRSNTPPAMISTSWSRRRAARLAARENDATTAP